MTTSPAPAANADSPAAERIALFLLVFIVAVALGITGAAVKGLLFLLVIAVIIFALNLLISSADSQAPAKSGQMTRAAPPAQPAQILTG